MLTHWLFYVFTIDTFTNTETSVAKIKTPASWKGLNDWSVMWTEYFGTPLASCASLPYSKVTFFNPVANGGAYKPRSSAGSNALSTSGTCNNSAIRSVVGGASQEMGTSPPATRNLVDTRNASRTVECAFGAIMVELQIHLVEPIGPINTCLQTTI